jgi:hypothetical protein
MRKSNAILISVFLLALTVPGSFGQVLKGSREPERKAGETSSIPWGDKTLAAQLAGNFKAGPRIMVPSRQGQNSALIGLLKRQRAASFTDGSFNPSDKKGLAASPAKATVQPVGTIKPGQVQSATKGGAPGANASAPTMAQPSNPKAPGSAVVTKPVEMCAHPGISDVNGAKSGWVFTPGDSVVINGCGFGDQPGAVYLMGVKQEPAPPPGFNTPPPTLHSDWVSFVASGASKHQAQRSWSNTQIEVGVDPNTSGFHDASNATLVVVLSDGMQQFHAAAFGFYAARAEQRLASLPRRMYGGKGGNLTLLAPGPDFVPAKITNSQGHPVQADLSSPSGGIGPQGHTFGVVRADENGSFSGGTDTLNLVYALQPDFEVSGIQPFFASTALQQLCASAYSTNGSWNFSQSGGADRLVIAWQEQGCGVVGVSVYAMDVFVNGPRGVSAF